MGLLSNYLRLLTRSLSRKHLFFQRPIPIEAGYSAFVAAEYSKGLNPWHQTAGMLATETARKRDSWGRTACHCPVCLRSVQSLSHWPFMSRFDIDCKHHRNWVNMYLCNQTESSFKCFHSPTKRIQWFECLIALHISVYVHHLKQSRHISTVPII